MWNKKNFLIIGSLLLWLVIGCEDRKYSQCQSLIAIANKATGKAQKITTSNSEAEIETKTWLQAADIMAMAAKEIEAVSIQDPQLIDYQADLADIFRIYARATYDAVEARENKNLSALTMARDNAQQAGQLNQELVTKINNYCLAE